MNRKELLKIIEEAAKDGRRRRLELYRSASRRVSKRAGGTLYEVKWEIPT